jgi:hypothetical protein
MSSNIVVYQGNENLQHSDNTNLSHWTNHEKVIVPVELLININEIFKMFEKERMYYREQILLLKGINIKLRANELKIIRTMRAYMESIREIIGKDKPKSDGPQLADYLCQICLDKPRDCLLEPCMHFCVCQGCVININDRKCPICRREVDYYQNVFIS